MTTKKAATRRTKRCDCVRLVNDALKDTNTELASEICIDWKQRKGILYPIVATRKRDSRKRERAKVLFPTYCPFCGKKYAKQENAT